jgi:hypothetical protein
VIHVTSDATSPLTIKYREHQYVALKIYIHNSVRHRELPFYEQLNRILPSKHTGANNVRKLLASFNVVGPHGEHIVLALQVSQMSIRDMDTVFMKGRGFDEEFVKGAVKELLEALDFLHTEAQSVHTGRCTLHLLFLSTHVSTHDHAMYYVEAELSFRCSFRQPAPWTERQFSLPEIGGK